MNEQMLNEHKHIKGWGVDADLEVRPYKPVHRFQENTGAHWIKPEPQERGVEILMSIERGRMAPVYGTVNPPRGLSGILRRFAFKHGEGNFSHWLPLLLADRVDFIEGMFEDVMHGKIPRLFGDGYRMDYKYDKKKFYYRVAKNVVITAGAIYLVKRLMSQKR